MNTTTFSGTFKHAILTAIMEFLYMPVGQRHGKQLESIILRNTVMMNSAVRAFRYKGELQRSAQAERGPVLAPKLHPDLIPEYEEMLRERDEISRVEEPLIKNFLAHVLNQSMNIEDYLLLLPTCVHQPVLQLNLTSLGDRQFPTPAHAACFLEKAHHEIQLIKERMATNLLFQL